MTTINEADIGIPSSPADRKAIQEKIDEIVFSRQRVKDQQSHISDIKSDLKKFKIPSKTISTWIKMREERNKVEVEQQTQETMDGYDLIFSDERSQGYNNVSPVTLTVLDVDED